MKQKMLIFVSLIFLIALLIGINAVSYKQKDKTPDSEVYPNRSTYNSGATGTRAFYDLLSETGRKVSRWQETPANLSSSTNKPSTFVIIGGTKLGIEENEKEQILRWVSEGGMLVIIDRHPPAELLKTTFGWTINTGESRDYPFGVDPTNQTEMILGVPAIKPSQASIFTRNVNAVQPSRFTTSLETKYGFEKQDGDPQTSITPYYAPIPAQTPENEISSEKLVVAETPLQQIAPFAHLGNGKDNILVDFPYGAGQIVVLSDPYIVANNGIKLVDNSKLAVNIVASREGLIAFDEFHQGFGANSNNFFGYFADTPVLPIFAQIFLIIGVLFWSQSQRFARPLPVDDPSRLSKLEYVSAMAELQQRTKALRFGNRKYLL